MAEYRRRRVLVKQSVKRIIEWRSPDAGKDDRGLVMEILLDAGHCGTLIENELDHLTRFRDRLGAQFRLRFHLFTPGPQRDLSLPPQAVLQLIEQSRKFRSLLHAFLFGNSSNAIGGKRRMPSSSDHLPDRANSARQEK